VLFVDADGATKFGDVEKLELGLKSVEMNGFGIAVGSRAHMVKTDAVVKVLLV
jgi:dolichyl-phosphate beta-glucosyltransferase